MYSKEYQEQTKETFLHFENSTLKDLTLVCMKNSDGRFGLIQSDHIVSNTWKIYERISNTFKEYTSLDELINDGWVID